MEWQAPLYINFVDFKKAFDSVKRDKIWTILKHYGVPEVFLNIIKEIYRDSESCVLEGGKTSGWFEVKTGVKQGCVMSGFIFIAVVDWIMKNTNNTRRGVRWKFTSVLEDLDYADDLALLSSRFSDMQEKTTRLHDVAEFTGLKINTAKTKTMRVNCRVDDNITVEGKDVEDVAKFTYLGSTMDKTGGAEQDIQRRLGLARTAFSNLQAIWKSAKYSQKTKIRIFSSNIIAVLLYSSETWRMTTAEEERLDIFHRKCLKRILRVHWPNIITNADLYARTGTRPLSCTIRQRRWRWIGHILRRGSEEHERTALTWTPEGRRKRGRPKNTWRRTAETERQRLGWSTWRAAGAAAADREGWRELLRGLMGPCWPGEVK